MPSSAYSLYNLTLYLAQHKASCPHTAHHQATAISCALELHIVEEAKTVGSNVNTVTLDSKSWVI